ncbi:hypothetical protein [Bacillus kwashiorkori]|uniref:PGAP1-like alpha/beta domain-containing protein n=1 Tax=Bacillus kwashiorkori TaxID=1522318 RepID=UPI0007846D2A|nr:hypothetical protein [Bacillus kwashiorkori]
MVKRISLMLFAFLLVLPLQTFAGSLGKGEPSTNPGEWFVGPTPSYIDPNKAPIVFVHGLNSSSSTWRDNNDMDEVAYQNGYETAFINLYPTKNMWDNGQLLATKLREIYNHFGGKKLVVVAHSKGGLDTQSALVHYNAHTYVKRVITLGSPHHGSQVANLAYSSWAGWMASLLGSKNDATFSLQTSYMTNFRNETDSHANARKVPFYTLAGTKWGSFGSALYWGGLYLSQYGQNDGLVTVASSRLPYGTELRVGSWNHTTIKEGSSTFSIFAPYLRLNSTDAVSKIERKQEEKMISAYYRGGNYQQSVKETFFVEDGVNEMTVDWMSEREKSNLTLVDPNGKEYSTFTTAEDATDVFQGSYHHMINIQNPAAGPWTIVANNEKEHYFLSVIFDSATNHSLDVEVKTDKDIQVIFNEKNQLLNKAGLSATVQVEFMDMKANQVKRLKAAANDLSNALTINSLGEGIYNITIDIQGKTISGKEFNRTIIQSVYVPATNTTRTGMGLFN